MVLVLARYYALFFVILVGQFVRIYKPKVLDIEFSWQNINLLFCKASSDTVKTLRKYATPLEQNNISFLFYMQQLIKLMYICVTLNQYPLIIYVMLIMLTIVTQRCYYLE